MSPRRYRNDINKTIHFEKICRNVGRKLRCFSSVYLQSDQQETKSRVLPHLLFYRNVFLS
jgi:hypothetical protein